MIVYYIMRCDGAAHKKSGVVYCHDEIKYFKRKGMINL